MAVSASALLAWRRWRIAITLLLIALAWVWLCATPIFANEMQDRLASRYPAQPAAGFIAADAILTVGGGRLPGQWPHWDANKDPALSTPIGYALALYRAGKAPSIVLSTAPGEGQRIAAVLVRQGVPPQALVIAPPSLSTHQDAQHAQSVLRRLHAHRILLVTYGRHMPRTRASFEAEDIDAVPAAAYEQVRTRPNGFDKFRYSAGALYLSTACLHEYLGLLYYRLRGWATW